MSVPATLPIPVYGYILGRLSYDASIRAAQRGEIPVTKVGGARRGITESLEMTIRRKLTEAEVAEATAAVARERDARRAKQADWRQRKGQAAAWPEARP